MLEPKKWDQRLNTRAITSYSAVVQHRCFGPVNPPARSSQAALSPKPVSSSKNAAEEDYTPSSTKQTMHSWQCCCKQTLNKDHFYPLYKGVFSFYSF